MALMGLLKKRCKTGTVQTISNQVLSPSVSAQTILCEIKQSNTLTEEETSSRPN